MLNKHDNNFFSHWQTVRYGVPQGSILGPTLFLIYVNDLHKSTNAEIVQYADDTTIVCKNKESQSLWESVEDVFSSLNNWFTINGLSLNISKTQVIEFTPRHSQTVTEVDFKTFQLKTQHTVSLLGLTIDANLNWKDHIHVLKTRLHSAIFSIRTIRTVTDFKTLLIVYHAYFESLMSYGLIFWGSSTHSNNIFKLQKKVVRLIAKVPNRTSCREYFKSFKILTMTSLFIYQTSIMVKQNWSVFMKSQVIHSYDTRNKNKLKPVLHRLNIFEKSPQYLGPQIFNRLPGQFHQIEDTQTFKNKLKTWLLVRPYYSLNEFYQRENCF